MKPHNLLFERHCKGLLDDAALEELHRLLAETYFRAPETLDPQELEYAEDLVFELYTKKELNKHHQDKFRDMLASDQSLSRKYQLLKRLNDAGESWKALRLKKFLKADATDEEEERQLREVLQGVIEKAHAERETETVEKLSTDVLAHIRTFFRKLEPPSIIFRPQARMVLALASVVLVVVVIWVIVDRKPGELLPNNQTAEVTKPEDTTGNEPEILATESQTTEKPVPGNIIEEPARQAAFDNLIAVNYVPPEFEYTLTRGETTADMDLFIKAADKYNMKEWDRCAAILDGLLVRKAFQDPDSVNEIHFYLGQCYLQKAIAGKNNRYFDLAVKEFNTISPGNDYYTESQWYAALANLGLGKESTALHLLDSLLITDYEHVGRIKILKGKIHEIIKD